MDVHRTPQLPDAFSEMRHVLDNGLQGLALLKRPRNIALLASFIAAERAAQAPRAKAKELYGGLPLPDSTSRDAQFAHSVAEILLGLTVLQRAIDRCSSPLALPVRTSADILSEAEEALHVATIHAHLGYVFDDVLRGWRTFELVEPHTVRAMHKSPARLRRTIEVDIEAQAAGTSAVRRAATTQLRAELATLREMVRVERHGQANTYQPTGAAIRKALVHARLRDAAIGWQLPDHLQVASLFSVRQYRAVVDAVHATALLYEYLSDLSHRPDRRIVRMTRDRWVEVLGAGSRLEPAIVDRILPYLTHLPGNPRDEINKGTPAASTPFVDLGDGRLAMSSTLAMLQDPQFALRVNWNARAPTDYSAKVAQLGDELSDAATQLFKSRGWFSASRRSIPGVGDLDSVAAIAGDPFLIGVEAKVFTDDPIRGPDEPAVWRVFDANLEALRDADVFARVFPDSPTPCGNIVGLLLVPGRASAATDMGRTHSVIGMDNLRDLAEQARSPRDLWESIKAGELAVASQSELYEARIGDWTLVFDGIPAQGGEP